MDRRRITTPPGVVWAADNVADRITWHESGSKRPANRLVNAAGYRTGGRNLAFLHKSNKQITREYKNQLLADQSISETLDIKNKRSVSLLQRNSYGNITLWADDVRVGGGSDQRTLPIVDNDIAPAHIYNPRYRLQYPTLPLKLPSQFSNQSEHIKYNNTSQTVKSNYKYRRSIVEVEKPATPTKHGPSSTLELNNSTIIDAPEEAKQKKNVKRGELQLHRVRLSDAALYRCRVDMQASPTRNARVMLHVIGEYSLQY